MVVSPPISPKVATPLAHRKRRFSAVDKGAVIDLTGSEYVARPEAPRHGHQISVSTNKNGVTPPSPSDGTRVANGRKLEDDDGEGGEDDGSGDDKSLMEDMLDTAELEPYTPDDPEDAFFDIKEISRLHSRLRKIGPQAFLNETLLQNQMSPLILGTAFGINPYLKDNVGDEFFGRLLSAAVIRAYNKRLKLPQYNTIDDAASLLRERNNIMVITGAGISTSLGIPDFRSKQTGFYTKLLERGIEEPEQVFDIHEFDFDPRTFYELAADILPDLQRFSPTHAFIRLLQDKGKLQTNYTQNIDNLEELAGIDCERLIQCHGSFATATCRKCKHKVKGTEIFPDIRAKQVAKCKRCISTIEAQAALPKPKKRKPTPQGLRRSSSEDDDDEDDDIPEPGVMKPDITFFGEQLPHNFFDRFTERDAQSVDLVVVIGTSLKVAPVSEMPNYLPPDVPHIYISREPVEHVNFDVQLLGSCDDVVVELCRRAGWEESLRHEMIPEGFKASVEMEEEGWRWKVRRVNGNRVVQEDALDDEDEAGPSSTMS